MAVELRDVVGRYELLEKENQTKVADLKKAMDLVKRCALRLESHGRNFDKSEKLRLEVLMCCR